MDDVKEKIESLKKEINFHNYRYYVLDDPIISDVEYDKLMALLKGLEDKYPEFFDLNSPTQKVGGFVLDRFNKVMHKIPMLSLDDVFDDNEILEFDRKVKRLTNLNIDLDIQYMVEPKLDGLSINLIYENNKLSIASTRGDGIIGEDVTTNIRTIKNIPLVLIGNHVVNYLDVQGEAIITRSEFIKLNNQRKENGLSLFANPRNAAAGSIRQLDSKETAKRHLKMFVYYLREIKGFNAPKTQWESLEILNRLGFPVNPLNKLCKNVDDVLNRYRHLKAIRGTLDYEIDGVVVKVNDFELQKKLGFTSKAPRFAIALKFEASQATTRILDISVNIGRSGILTPVAKLNPVNVGGAVISKASLHTMDEIKKKDIRIGDYVFVQRAGDVIPEVVSPIKDKRNGSERFFKMPEKCPVCSSDVVKDGAYYVCTNINCPAVIKESIKHFVSKSAMNIDGLRDKLIEQLVDKGLVKDISDIYKLKKSDLLKLDRMGDKLADNIISAIQRSKGTTFAKFLTALGIRHVGVFIARILSEKFNSIEDLKKVSKEDLLSIKGIGDEIGESIVTFFKQGKNLSAIDKMFKMGVHFKKDEEELTKSLIYNKSFAFTGVLSMPRDKAKNLVLKRGGIIRDSISKRLDYLVIGENPGSKLDKAKIFNVKILSEDDFKKLVGA